MNDRLTKPPLDARERELWLQHAAGFIIFRDARQYAINKLPSNLSKTCREAALKGIDDAIYGMMMIFDGVTGSLDNNKYSVSLDGVISLSEVKKADGSQSMNIKDGDGFCMAYHGWKEGDYGENRPVK